MLLVNRGFKFVLEWNAHPDFEGDIWLKRCALYLRKYGILTWAYIYHHHHLLFLFRCKFWLLSSIPLTKHAWVRSLSGWLHSFHWTFLQSFERFQGIYDIRHFWCQAHLVISDVRDNLALVNTQIDLEAGDIPRLKISKCTLFIIELPWPDWVSWYFSC